MSQKCTDWEGEPCYVQEPEESCPECGQHPASEPHPCPYQSDINGDDTALCKCCVNCQNNCADDI